MAKGLTSTTGLVVLLSLFGVPLVEVAAAQPNGVARRHEASASAITRTALGVTVSRPFGETATNDSAGFDGAGAFTRVPLPHGAAASSTLGPDGSIWFVDQDGFIVRFNPTTRKTKRFDTGGASGDIATGADGRIYAAVSQTSGSQVTVLTPEGRKIRDIDVPHAVLTLEPAAKGVWFSSSDLGYPQRQSTVGRIAPDGSIRVAQTDTTDEQNGPLVGKLRPEALARLSDGTLGVAGVSSFRFRSAHDRAPDPLFAGATGNDRFGPIGSALGGANGELFVARITQFQDHSVIWRSAAGAAAPYVLVPDEPLRQQFEPDDASDFEAGTVVPTAFGPDGKLWFASWRERGHGIRTSGFLGPADDQAHLTQWRMPYPAGEIDSAVATESLTVGIDGRVWFTDSERGMIVGFRAPDLKGWRSLNPSIVSARREKGRAAVRIRCVGAPGKLCFGQASLTRGGKRVGLKLNYAVRAHAKGAGPEIVRYLKLPAGSTRGLAVRLSNGPRATVTR